MWRKIGVAIIAIISTFSVAYAINHEMFAATTTYKAGGNVDGRVNISPSSSINGSNIGLQKGDKLVTGTYNGKNLGWQLILKETYNDYGCTTMPAICTGQPSITNWLVLGTDSVASVKPINNVSDAFITDPGNSAWKVWMSSATNFYRESKEVTNTMKKNSITNSLFAYRNLTTIHQFYGKHTNSAFNHFNKATFNDPASVDQLGKSTFIPNRFELLKYDTVQAGNYGKLDPRDLAFYSVYPNGTFMTDAGSGQPFRATLFNSDGTFTGENNSLYTSFNVRLASYFDLSNVVFAVSQGISNTIATVSETELPSSYSNLYTTTSSYKNMKPRVLNQTMDRDTTFSGVTDPTGETSMSEAVKNGKAYLKVSAQAGSSSAGVNTISAIIFDSNKKFKYYRPLASTMSGENVYELDLSGIPVGDYWIGIVNEVYNDYSFDAMDSSKIKGADILKVVEPMTLSYRSTPDAGIAYEYSKNVGVGANIGVVDIRNGAGSPHTVKLLDDVGKSGDYKYFIAPDPLDGAASVNISVGNTPLEAGTYDFIVEVTDEIGLTAQVPVQVVVKKTSPNLSFTSSEDRAVVFVKGDTFTESITHSNTDTSDSQYDVSYNVSNATISVSKGVDENASITMNNIGKAVISVSTAETKNFNAETKSKSIEVYQGMSNFHFTPSKTPIFTSDTSSANYNIGALGVTGGSAPYTYTIEADPNGSAGANDDGAKFAVNTTNTNATKLDVTTKTALLAGTYKVTFKITDAKGQTIYSETEIKVQRGSQSGFEFYDYKDPTSIVTNKKISIPYGTSDAKVIAKGGQSTGDITYALATDQPNDIISIDPTSGDITILGMGTAKVEATKGDDVNFEAVTIAMDIEISKASQTITFDSTIPSSIMFHENAIIEVPATITRNDGTSGPVTYTSKVPTVCSVDTATVSKVKMLTKGSCIIEASNTDSQYVEAKTTKTIELYPGISGTFLQLITPLPQGSPNALVQTSTPIAKVTNLAGGDGTITYKAIKSEMNGLDMSSYFDMNANGSIYPAKNLKYGEYDMEVTLEDGNGLAGQVKIAGKLSVGLEQNASFKITSQDKVETTITQDYASAKAVPILLDTVDKKGGGTVHFKLTDKSNKDPNESEEAISIDDSGVITVHRAMTLNDEYKIYAYVDEDVSNGLAKQVSQEVEIKITNTPQSIAFNEDVPTQVKFVKDGTFQATASITRSDHTTGVLKYTTTTPVVCMIEDETNAIVKMITKGTCIVKAENSDKNYVAASQSKSIQVYDGLSGGYVQTINPLRQGSTEALANSGVTLAKVINIAGDQGPLSYSQHVELNGVDVSSKFEIDTSGEIKPLEDIKYGTYDVEITIQDNTGVSGQAIVIGQLNVELEVNDSFFITYKGNKVSSISEGFTTASKGMSVGTVGKKAGQVHFALSASSAKDPNETMEAISISDAGVITVNRVTTANDKYQIYAYIDQDTTQGLEKQVTPEIPVTITNAQMNPMRYLVDGIVNTVIQKTYDVNGSIQLDIEGEPSGSVVNYALVMDASGMNNGIKVDDVVSLEVDGNGNTTGKLNILNASLANQINQVQIQATVSCSGYTDSVLPPIPVLIDKAEQENFRFAQPVYQMPSGSGSFTPVLTGGVKHDDGVTLNYRLDCSDPYDVSVDSNDPTTFHYNVNELDGADITIKAKNYGNRNYNMKETTALLRVLKPGVSLFDVDVKPGRVITYGNHVTLEPILVDGENATFTYTSLDTSILRQDTVTENVFISENIGTTQIQVTKKVSGKADADVLVTIKVNPKPVQVELDQTYTMKVGEAIPSFSLKPFDTGVIINNDQISNPTITTSATDSTMAGTYPITITYPNDPITNRYKFTQIPADLTIVQDEGQKDWIIVYPDGINPIPTNNVDLSKWYASDMVVKLVANATSYDEISPNRATWSDNFIISKEGEVTSNVYFKKGDTGALSTPISTTVKVDKTKPTITSITGENFNITPLTYFMNAITLNTFFKPGTEIEIKTEDVNANPTILTSGVDIVHYQVYELDEKGGQGNIIEEDDIIVNRDGIASFKMEYIGQYRVCATAKDNAGNVSDKGCADVMVKKIDIDVDDDNELDFNDPDGDGCPDLNIKWKNLNNEWVKLNIDKNKDGIPELDIDSDGDGKADINIDSDNDGKPDVNLLMLKEWKPDYCVRNQMEEYCTMQNLKGVINVDVDYGDKGSPLDGIPDINIDDDGDMKADLNITRQGEIKPYLNIINALNVDYVHQWPPIHDYQFESFTYDSVGVNQEGYIRKLNVDTDGDMIADLNVDLNGDDEPDINIDLNGDEIPDIEIDGNGDGIPDINVDKIGNGLPDENVYVLKEWRPDKTATLNGVSYNYMEIKLKDELSDNNITINRPNGVFLPNFALRVNEITKSIDESIKKEILKDIDKKEIFNIYEIALLKDNVKTQPDGTIIVSMPVNEGIKNPKIMVQQKDGSYRMVEAVEENGCYQFETDYLGLIGIVGDQEEIVEPTPEPDTLPDSNQPKYPDETKNPDTSVKGSYTNIGGALTGDTKDFSLIAIEAVISLCIIFIYMRKQRKWK